jgi:hypothetical protein
MSQRLLAGLLALAAAVCAQTLETLTVESSPSFPMSAKRPTHC